MKCFLAVVFLATAAFALPDYGYPRPPMDHQLGHPHRPHQPQVSHELLELISDMMDFQKLLPLRQIERIVYQHLEDPALIATLEFLETPEFEQIAITIGNSSEIAAVEHYLESADWPWIHNVAIEAIDRMLAQKRIASRQTVSGGLNGLLDAIVAVLPKQQLRALFEEKMETRAVFRAVVDILTSVEFKGLIRNVKQSPVLRTQFELLAAQGIDIEKICETAKSLFGF